MGGILVKITFSKGIFGRIPEKKSLDKFMEESFKIIMEELLEKLKILISEFKGIRGRNPNEISSRIILIKLL